MTSTTAIPEFEPAPYDQSMASQAYRNLAEKTGRSLEEITHLADQNQLGVLFENGVLIEPDEPGESRSMVEHR
jgi:hypothetical protein